MYYCEGVTLVQILFWQCLQVGSEQSDTEADEDEGTEGTDDRAESSSGTDDDDEVFYDALELARSNSLSSSGRLGSLEDSSSLNGAQAQDKAPSRCFPLGGLQSIIVVSSKHWSVLQADRQIIAKMLCYPDRCTLLLVLSDTACVLVCKYVSSCDCPIVMCFAMLQQW